MFNRLWERYQQSTLLKSGTWYFVGSILARSFTFLGIVVFTRLLAPEDYGKVAVFLIWFNTFSNIGTLNLRSAVFRAKFDHDEAGYRRFLGAIVALGVFLSLVQFGLLAALPADWVERIFSLEKPYLLLAAWAVPFAFTTYVRITAWEAASEYQKATFSHLLIEVANNGLAVLLLVLPFYGFLDPVFQRAGGITLGFMLIGLCYVAADARRDFWYPAAWTSALAYAVPLIPHVLAGQFLNQFDRIIISQYEGERAVGIYSLAYQIGYMTVLVWGAVNTSWITWLYNHLNQQNFAIIRRRSNQYILGFTALSVSLMLASPLFIRLIVARDYWSATPLLPVLFAGSHLYYLYSFFGNIEFYAKKTAYISLSTILSAGLNIGLNYLLIPRWGYEAAALTTLISYLGLLLAHYGIVRFVLKEAYHASGWLIAASASGVMGLAAFLYFLLA